MSYIHSIVRELEAEFVTRYTSRRYRSYSEAVVNSLRENGIEKIVSEKGLDSLGIKIADKLWAMSQGSDDFFHRKLTKSAYRSKRKREQKEENGMLYS